MRGVLLQRPVVATLAIAILWLAYWSWGVLSAGGKFEPKEYFADQGAVNVEVVLKFPPETFHMLILQDTGRVTRVEGPSIFVRDAQVGLLYDLAQRPWVTGIKAWEG